MIWYFLILWALIYVFLIFKSFIELKKLKNLLDVMSNYLNSASLVQGYPLSLNKNENYGECLNELLLNYPSISRYTTSYTDALEYGCPDLETYGRTYKLYKPLLMKRNFLLDYFYRSFNPLISLKTLFCFPASFIRWIGFHPGDLGSKILSLISWIIVYILNLYSDEIKVLLNSLF